MTSCACRNHQVVNTEIDDLVLMDIASVNILFTLRARNWSRSLPQLQVKGMSSRFGHAGWLATWIVVSPIGLRFAQRT